MPVIATVLGRGHSGTRGIAGWLRSAGFDIGPKVNGTNDYASRDAYLAARIAGEHIDRVGHLKWDFERILTGPISQGWRDRAARHLAPVYGALGRTGKAAWKLPECVFWAPWLARVYPEIRLLVVHRDPRDVLLKNHGTDDLAEWGVPVDRGGTAWSGERKKVESWKLQTDLLLATQEAFPKQVLSFRLWDYVNDHDSVRRDVSRFLGVPMPQGETKAGPVGRHKADFHRRQSDHTATTLAQYTKHFDGADPGLFRHVPPGLRLA